MDTHKVHLFRFVFVHCCMLLFSPTVLCKDNDPEANLIDGINALRKTKNLPSLKKNDNADCIADKVADYLVNRKCDADPKKSNFTYKVISGHPNQVSNFTSFEKDCKLNKNTTMDGIVLPVCVPELEDGTLLNFTHSETYTNYLNDSKYTGYGIGHKDDWMVIVLSTNTRTGSFEKSAVNSLIKNIGFGGFNYLILPLWLFFVFW